MEFKKSYTFRDSLPFAIFFGFFVVLLLVLIIWLIIYGISHCEFPEILIPLIPLVIGFAGGLFVIIIFASQYVTIDEEKIVWKGLIGPELRFNINDIYKIEIKPGPKKEPVFIIYGNSPQINSQKCKVKTINIFADKKREEILKHFITNPEVWQIEVEAEYYKKLPILF